MWVYFMKSDFFIFKLNKKVENGEFCDARHLIRSFRVLFFTLNPFQNPKIDILGFFEVLRFVGSKMVFAIFDRGF